MRGRLYPYNKSLKHRARQLRKDMTDSELLLWSRLRGKQILGVQFYRQKLIGNYIVDFFAPKTKLAVEVDGSQHGEEDHSKKDTYRDAYLATLGIRVLRFNSREVLKNPDGVLEVIFQSIEEKLNQ